ncbi:MAG: ABC transporter permease subunit [Phycisphaerales bacterium]|nr:ABC transporter permease subunit [Phycisphaerales bacterium]
MRPLVTIAQRELTSMFRVPAGWIIIALFAFLTAVLFVNLTVIPGQPGSLRYFFSYASWLLIPIAPAISMRLIAEEYRSGSFEALRTTPAGEWSVAMGKYLASVAFLILMLVPTLVYPITLFFISDPAPDLGPIFSGYLMLVLVGSLYLAVGLVASALTPSQTLAFLGTLMALILWMVLTSLVASKAGVTLHGVLSKLSISNRINELSKGVIDTTTLAFFLIGIVWMLVLTTGVLEIRRLGRSRLIVAPLVIVFVAATGAAAFFAGVLSTEHHTRFDATSTGAHQLSARAHRMVDRLDGPTQLVLAINLSQRDRQSVDLVGDVLEAYDRSSPLITASTIDLGSPNAINQTNALIARLVDRDRSEIESSTQSLRDAGESLDDLVRIIEHISPALESVASAIDPGSAGGQSNQGFFAQRASLMRVAGRELVAQRLALQSQLDAPTGIGGLPAFNAIVNPIADSLGRTLAQLDDLAAQLDAFTKADTIDTSVRTQTRPIIESIASARHHASLAHELVRTINPIDAQRVGLAFQSGGALLVIGSHDQGIAAVDLDAVLLPAAAIEQAGGSPAGIIGPRAQELLASALGQLVAPAQPILVLVHGHKPGDLLGGSTFFNRAAHELAQRGINTIEWAAVESPTHPDMSSINPGNARPVIYMVIAVNSAASAGDTGLSGAKRATAMGDVVARLVDQGKPVLVSLSPSIFPTYGDPDPVAAITAQFGIIPDTGHTLLHDEVGPLGRLASPLTQIVQPEADDDAHPIADALDGLTALLPWAINLELVDTQDASAKPIIVAQGDDDTWAESRWLRLKSIPADRRAYYQDQPIYDENTDTRLDSYILGAAGERRRGNTTQRMIVIGSNDWANDAVTYNAERLVDGHVTRRYPANAVLLQSSIAWLAGMDDLIAPGADARPIATINPLDSKQLTTLRWILLGGIPGLVLILAMAFRLIFG